MAASAHTDILHIGDLCEHPTLDHRLDDAGRCYARPRRLTVVLPNNGKPLPHSNIDIQLPDANLTDDEYAYVAIRNLQDDKWYITPCIRTAGNQATCTNVVVGKDQDALGPWDLWGIVVTAAGRKIIVDNKRMIAAELDEVLGKELVAVGKEYPHRQ